MHINIWSYGLLYINSSYGILAPKFRHGVIDCSMFHIYIVKKVFLHLYYSIHLSYIGLYLFEDVLAYKKKFRTRFMKS